MPLTHCKIAVTALGVVALAASTCAAQAPPAKESQVGKKVDSAIESFKKGASTAGEAIREQYEKARTSIHNMGVASRVYGRLHWDKALNAYKIDVEVRQDGVATLTGSVGDAVARARAVDLTRETVGVTNVVDRLAIVPTSPGATPAAKP